MQSNAATVQEYLAELPADRQEPIGAVRDVVNANLPAGYREAMAFGMIGWGIPLEDYPNTYNGKPLGIAALASQKNHMALYLMGLYGNASEEAWFRQQYADRGLRLDMGKSCVRFTRLDQVPLDVIAAVIAKIPPEAYLARYEQARARSSKRPKPAERAPLRG